MKINQLLTEAETNSTFSTDPKVELARSIIQRHTTARAPFRDFMLRIAAYTNGTKIPRAQSSEIDIIPALEELRKAGLVTLRQNGAYLRTDTISRLLSLTMNSVLDTALQNKSGREGALQYTHGRQLDHLVGDGNTRNKLDAAPRNYKQGGKYSGTTKEFIIKVTKDHDPAWHALSDDTRRMIAKLATLPEPEYAFKVLRSLINMRNKKKGYVNFIASIERQFKNQRFIDAFYDLENIGVINSNENTINTAAIKQIRDAIGFFKAESFEGIPAMDKVRAFLPNFAKSAVAFSATTYMNATKANANAPNRLKFSSGGHSLSTDNEKNTGRFSRFLKTFDI